MESRRPLRVEPVREGEAATTIELFFDLVFVFALTQITAMMADDLTVHGLFRGVLVLAVIWWSWVSYSWLSSLVRADEGAARVAMFTAMAAMLLIALVVPEAFDDLPGGVSGPVAFALAYVVVRAVHLVLFLMASGGDPGLRRQVGWFSATMVGSTVLLLLAAENTGHGQTLLWVAAVLVDYGGTLAIGSAGWRLNAAAHFAERHGLIIIVALGESIVAIGVGVAQLPVSWPIILATALGLSVSASLWWVYFDTTAPRAERRLAGLEGPRQVAMAQVAYTYLHLPMLVGVVMSALGLKEVLHDVGDTRRHQLSDPLPSLPLAAFLGGLALYLLAVVAFARRTYGAGHGPRILVAGLLLALVPGAVRLPALASLGIAAAVLAGLNLTESWRHAEVRHAVRHHRRH